MTPEDHLTLTPPKPCPGCNSTGKHRPFCPEVYAMTFAPQPRPTFASLTDAQVRALLDPEGCSDDDYDEAADAHLVHMTWPEMVAGGPCGPAKREHYGDAKAILAEAQRIADGLPPNEARVLAYAADGEGTRHSIEVVAAAALRYAHLVDYGRDDEGRVFLRILPAGRLVLALRERSKETA